MSAAGQPVKRLRAELARGPFYQRHLTVIQVLFDDAAAENSAAAAKSGLASDTLEKTISESQYQEAIKQSPVVFIGKNNRAVAA